MRRSTNECLFGTVTTQSVCEDSPTPGLSQSCYTCFSDSKKYQNCKALNYNCRDAILSISDVTKVSWRSYLQKKLFKSTCELEWKGHIFQNKNFHFNPRLKKVHVLVNGILQFTHFMPLGCFFFLFCVLLPLFTSLRETFYLANTCKLSPYVSSAEHAKLLSFSLNTDLIPSRWQHQICCKCQKQHQGCQKASLHMTQISEQLRHI